MELKTAIAGGFEFLLLGFGLVILWRVYGRVLTGRVSAPPSPLSRWDIAGSSFALFLWAIFVGGLVFQYAAVAVLPSRGKMDDDTFQLLAGAAFQAGMILAYVVARLLIPGMRAPCATGPRSGGNPLVAGALVFLAALPIVMAGSFVWQNLLEIAGIEVKQQDLIGIFENTDSAGLLALILGLAIVVAPAIEELVFRAGIFRFARHRLPRFAALLLPATLFGALHLNLATFVPLVLLGIVFSIAFERTGDIRVSIVAHSLFNLNTSVLVLLGVNP